MNTSNLLNTQLEYLSICLIKPETLKDTLLKKEYFRNDLQEVFEIMKKCYESTNTLVFQELLTKGINDELLLNLSSFQTVSTDKKYVQRLEAFIIECYQKNQILKMTKELHENKIELSTFYKNISDIQKMKSIRYSKIDFKTLENILTNKNTSIHFDKNKVLEARTKMKEHDLAIIGGRTGTGKTAYALNLVNDLSRTYPILYFNMEMSESVLLTRLIAIESNEDISDIESNDKSKEKWSVKEAMKTISNRDITIVSESQSIESIRRIIANNETSDKHLIVIIDHLGLVKADGKSLYEKMTNAVQECRRIALDYNCTIFGLCQLARDSKDTENKKPSKYQLKNSGEIECSARQILMLYEDSGKYYIDIQKNSYGSESEFEVNFDKRKQKITEVRY